jgi:ubiquinone/menaquinone biosynthesis C-methylase UbiE
MVEGIWSSPAMTALDVYRITDKLDDDTSEVLVKRLEARGRHPAFVKMMHQYFDTMRIDEARRVLDLGCGTGVAGRSILSRPDFAGEVTGIDLSPYLIQVGSDLAAKEGFAGRMHFRVGNTHKLATTDGEFDAVVLHTLISHVDDPLTVLREARRLVKPGGMIGIFDGDYASLTFAQDDPNKAMEDDAAIIRSVVTNPRVMRQMPRLLRTAELDLVAFYPHVVAEAGEADYWLPGIASFRALLPKAGAMTDAAAVAWADQMLKSSETGVFFGASNYYTYVARLSSR